MSLAPLNLDLAATQSSATLLLSPSNGHGGCLLSPPGVTTQSDLDTDACVELALRSAEVASPDIQSLLSANRNHAATTPSQPDIPECSGEEVGYEVDESPLVVESYVTVDGARGAGQSNAYTPPPTFTSNVVVESCPQLEFSAELTDDVTYHVTSPPASQSPSLSPPRRHPIIDIHSESSHVSVDSQDLAAHLNITSEHSDDTDDLRSDANELRGHPNRPKTVINIRLSIDCPYYDYSPYDVVYRPAARWCDRFVSPEGACSLLAADMREVDQLYCQRMLYAAGFALIAYRSGVGGQIHLTTRQYNVPISEMSGVLTGALDKAIDVGHLLQELRKKFDSSSVTRGKVATPPRYDVIDRSICVDKVAAAYDPGFGGQPIEVTTARPSQVKAMRFQPPMLQQKTYRNQKPFVVVQQPNVINQKTFVSAQNPVVNNKIPTPPKYNQPPVMQHTQPPVMQHNQPPVMQYSQSPVMQHTADRMQSHPAPKPQVQLPGAPYPFASTQGQQEQSQGHLRYIGSRY